MYIEEAHLRGLLRQLLDELEPSETAWQRLLHIADVLRRRPDFIAPFVHLSTTQLADCAPPELPTQVAAILQEGLLNPNADPELPRQLFQHHLLTAPAPFLPEVPQVGPNGFRLVAVLTGGTHATVERGYHKVEKKYGKFVEWCETALETLVGDDTDDADRVDQALDLLTSIDGHTRYIADQSRPVNKELPALGPHFYLHWARRWHRALLLAPPIGPHADPATASQVVDEFMSKHRYLQNAALDALAAEERRWDAAGNVEVIAADEDLYNNLIELRTYYRDDFPTKAAAELMKLLRRDYAGFFERETGAEEVVHREVQAGWSGTQRFGG